MSEKEAVSAPRIVGIYPPARGAEVVDCIVDALSPRSRRWCYNDVCACMGCVNFVLTPEEWDGWQRRHGFL